jgi:hypothetical protein
VSSSTLPNTATVGVSFTQNALPYNITADQIGNVSMSADGRYITYLGYNSIVGKLQILYSSNYGSSFTGITNDTNIQYKYVRVSSTGQFQAALVDSGGVYFSSNYGVTWTNVGLSSVPNWGGIYISTDGKIVVAWQGGGSTNYYITKDTIPTGDDSWSNVQNFSNTIIDLKMSANGDRVLQVYYGVGDVPPVVKGYKVNRNGDLTNLSASPSDPYGLTVPNNQMVSLSGDGTRIGVYGSDNSNNIVSQQISWSISGSGSLTDPVGTTKTILSGASWYSSFPSAMSSNGAVQLVAGGQNYPYGVYISYNYGVTWSAIAQSSNPNIPSLQWYYILISSDGGYINIFQNSSYTAWGQCHTTSPTLTVTNIPYTPAAPLTWPTNYIPTTIGGALDTIAKFLYTTQGFQWTNFS